MVMVVGAATSWLPLVQVSPAARIRQMALPMPWLSVRGAALQCWRHEVLPMPSLSVRGAALQRWLLDCAQGCAKRMSTQAVSRTCGVLVPDCCWLMRPRTLDAGNVASAGAALDAGCTAPTSFAQSACRGQVDRPLTLSDKPCCQ